MKEILDVDYVHRKRLEEAGKCAAKSFLLSSDRCGAKLSPYSQNSRPPVTQTCVCWFVLAAGLLTSTSGIVGIIEER